MSALLESVVPDLAHDDDLIITHRFRPFANVGRRPGPGDRARCGRIKTGPKLWPEDYPVGAAAQPCIVCDDLARQGLWL